MAKVTVIRHAKYEYPEDRLSEEGIAQSIGSKERFSGYSKVVCSPANRSQQTAQYLGHEEFTVDERLREFEAPIKAPTAEEYIKRVHLKFARQLATYGQNLLAAIEEYGYEDTLFVTHNAVMSACLLLLTEEVAPFQNLGGFEVEVQEGQIVAINKIE